MPRLYVTAPCVTWCFLCNIVTKIGSVIAQEKQIHANCIRESDRLENPSAGSTYEGKALPSERMTHVGSRVEKSGLICSHDY